MKKLKMKNPDKKGEYGKSRLKRLKMGENKSHKMLCEWLFERSSLGQASDCYNFASRKQSLWINVLLIRNCWPKICFNNLTNYFLKSRNQGLSCTWMEGDLVLISALRSPYSWPSLETKLSIPTIDS